MEKRKIAILLAILFIVAGLFYYFVIYSNRGVIFSGLSRRAQEYIQSEKYKNSQTWNGVSFDGMWDIKIKENNTPNENECFTLQIPFHILRKKSQGHCNDYYTFSSPRGTLTVYQQSVQFASLSDDPSIMLRRSKPEIYTEKNVKINDRSYTVYIEKGDAYQETAFYLSNGEEFVIHLIGYTAEDMDADFLNILRSLKFK